MESRGLILQAARSPTRRRYPLARLVQGGLWLFLSCMLLAAGFANDDGGSRDSAVFRPLAAALPAAIAHWRFDGTALDAVGSNHGFRAGDASYVANGTDGGVGSHALSLDGVSGYVNLDSNVSNFPLLDEPRSVTGWFKADAGSQGQSYFAYGPNTLARRFSVAADNTQAVVGLSGHAWGVRGLTLADGWHHIAVTYAGGKSDAISIYIDGALQPAATLAGVPLLLKTATGRGTIGQTVTRTVHYGGLIDDVRLYGEALGAEQVQSIYAQDAPSGSTPPPPPPPPDTTSEETSSESDTSDEEDAEGGSDAGPGEGRRDAGPRVGGNALAEPEVRVVSGQWLVAGWVPEFEGARLAFMLHADAAPGEDLEVIIEVSGGEDFVAAGETGDRVVVLPAGRRRVGFEVSTEDDAVAEDPMSAVVTAMVRPGAGYGVAREPLDAAVAEVHDNDGLPLVSIGDGMAGEDEDVRMEIVLSRPVGHGVRVDWETWSGPDLNADRSERGPGHGSAVYGADFRHGDGTAVFYPGDTLVEIWIRTLEDDGQEGGDVLAKDFTVLLDGAVGAVVGDGEATGLIIDDEERGLVLAPDRLSVPEGGAGSYLARLTRAPEGGDVEVALGGVSGTGVAVGADPGAGGTRDRLVFTARDWDEPRRVSVSAGRDDDDVDDDVSITHRLSGGGYGAAHDRVLPVVVPDDGNTGTLVGISGGGTVEEGVVARFTLTADPAPVERLWVAVEVSQAGRFTRDTGAMNVAIGPGGTAVLDIPTVDDAWDEPDGLIMVEVARAPGYTPLRSGRTAEIAVTDNEGAPNDCVPVELRSDVEGYAGEAERGRAHVDRWMRVLAAFGEDNGHEPMSAWLARVYLERGWMRWAPVVDALDCLQGSAAAPVPVVTVSGGGAVAEGGGAGFTVTASPAPASDLDVNLVVADDAVVDFLRPGDEGGRVVTVPAGQAGATVTLATVDDDAETADGAVSVSVAGGAGYRAGVPGTARVAVLDNDATPMVSISDGQASEGEDIVLEISLSEPAGHEVRVDWEIRWGRDSGTGGSDSGTATSGSDFVHDSGTAVLYPGDTRREIWIRTLEDDDPEGGDSLTEDFTVVLRNAEGAGIGDGEASAVIVDDDARGLVLAPDRLRLPEGGAGSYMARLTRPPGGGDVAVRVDGEPATGITADVDAGAAGNQGTLVFTASDWDRPRRVLVRAGRDDDAADSLVALVHTASGGGYGSLEPRRLEVAVEDGDTRGLVLSADTLAVPEGGSARYTVRLATAPAGGDVTLDIGGTGGGDITVDTDPDRAGAQSSLIFTSSDWRGPRVVLVSAAEDDDAVDDSVALPHVPSGADYGPSERAEIRIGVDDNDTRGVTVAPAELRIAEADLPDTVAQEHIGAYTLELLSEPTDVVAIDIVVPDGAPFAVGGSRPTFTPSTWDQARTVTVTALDDNIDNAGDQRRAVIAHTLDAGSSDYAGVEVSGVSVTVADDDETPVARLLVAPATINEDGSPGTATVTASLSRPSHADVSLRVSASPVAPARAGGVALGSNRLLSIAAGSTRGTGAVTVSARDNAVDAPDAAFTISATAAGGGVAAPAGRTLTVIDDEATTVTLARAGSGGIDEAGGTEDVTVTLGRELVAGEGVTVPLTVSGATVATHYTLSLKGNGGTGVSLDTAAPHSARNPAVTLAGAGAQTATLSLTAVPNTDNASRTVSIAYGTGARAPSSSGLSGGITTTGSAAVPILDDDAMVSVADAGAAEGSAVVFTVTLPEVAPNGGVTIGYSTSDGRGESTDATHQIATGADDYTAAAASASITIAQGDSSGTISIATTQDTTYEGDHHFTLTLDSTNTFNISDTAGSATGTITDAADTPSFAFPAASTAADEGDGTVTLTVEKTGTTLVAATVSYATTNGTATGGSDFTAITSTDLSFAVADTSKDITVSLTDDSVDEPAEAFTVDLAAGSDAQLGSTNSHSIGIADNDATTVTLEAPSTAIDEDAGTKTITVTLGRVLTGDETLDVPLTFSGTASFGDDYALAEPNSTPTGVTYSNLASSDLTANPPTISFSGVNSAASSATVILTAEADTTDEGTSEDVTVGLGTLNANSGTNLDGGASGSGTASFNITDDDDAPAGITLTLDKSTIAEDAATATVKVTATVTGGTAYATDKTVSVKVGKSTDSAVEGTDYANVADFDLTINAMETSAERTFSLDPTDDTLDEDTEILSVTGTSGDITVAGTSVTITDNDAEPVLSIDSPAVTESDGGETAMLRFTVSLDTESGREVTVAYAGQSGGTATPGTDYQALTTGTLTFDAGDTQEHFDITVTGDDTDEPDETVLVRLSSPSNATLSGGAETLDGTGTITDDDDAPTVSVANATAVIEGNDPDTTVDMSFTVTLSAASAKAITVPYTLSGTATGGSDYETPASTSLSIPAGDSGGTITIRVKGDALDEPNETVIVTLGAPTNATVSTTAGAGTGTGTITDDDSTPVVTLKLSSASVTEDGGSSTVTATLSGASSQAVSLTVAAAAVSPAVTGDFMLSANKTLSIAAGDTTSTGTVTVTAVDNDVDAANRTVTVSATATGGNGVADPANATLNITDDDERGISVSPVALTLDEADDPLTESIAEHQKTYTVELDSQPTGTVTVNLSSGDTKIATLSETSLEFTPSDWDAQTVTVTAVPDAIDNAGDERTVTITHTVSAMGTDYKDETAAAVEVTVTDDDGEPTLSIDSPNVAEGDSSTATMTFKVTLSPASGKPVSVTYADAATGTATPATDYAAISSGTLNFVAGDTEKTVAVTVNGDTTDEPNETVILRLSSPSNAALSGGAQTLDGTGTINDDDATPTATLVLTPATIDESGNGNESTVTATLSGTSSEAVTLTVAATAVSPAVAGDLTLSTNKTLTIAAGSRASTGAVRITAVDNSVDAPNKTVTVSAAATGGGVAVPANATLTITDDDTRGVTVVGGTLSLDETDTAGTQNAREDQGSYTVVLTSEPTDDVRIDITAPSMVTLSPTSLTFTPSNWNQAQTVTATAVNDAIDNAGDERADSIAHTVVAGESDYDGVTAASVAVTVSDDDDAPPGIALTVDEDEIAEDAGKTSITVTARVRGATRYAAAKTVTVTLGKSTDSAESGVDYAAVTAFDLELGAGEASVSRAFDLTPTDDALDEADETISVTGESGSLSVTGASITLTDDDERGISVSPVALTLDEADDPLTESIAEHQKTYTVELDSQPTGTVTVNLSSGDTKIATLSETSLEFTPSDWDAQTVTVTAVPDAIDNAGDERTVTITHTVSAMGTDYKDETAAAVEVTVTDDDGEPTLSIDSPNVAEGDSSTATMTFKVTLSPASGKPVSVTYADAATGTATPATDYAAISSGTLNFVAGDTEKTVAVTVNGDTTDEPNETVILRLSSPSNAALSGGAQTLDGTGTINDDDATPTATLVLTPATIDESGNGNESTVTATLSGTSSEAVTLTVAATAVSPAVAGDLTLSTNKTLTIAAGSRASTGAVRITAVDNSVDAPNKTVTVSAAATGGGVAVPANATLTITDDDTRGVTVVGGTLSLDETDTAGTQNAREDQGSYTVVLTSEPTDDVRIDITAPSMVTLSPTSLTFTPSNWNQAQTVTATAVNDAIDNAGDERADSIAHTVVAGESDYDGVTAASVAVTVSDDDDAPPGIALTVDEDEIAEDAGKTSITVTARVRGATRYAAAKTVTVTLGKSTDSAESGVDYAAVTAFDLELGAGEASVSRAFDLTPTDDALDEADETISVTGESGSLSVTGASITLTDDDERGISVSPVALTLDEADDPLTESIAEHQKTYTVELDSQPTGTVTVNLSSGDTKIATLSETSLEFTPSDWDAQTVTVTAVPDAIDNAGDERTVTITHTVSAMGTDYKDETAAAVEVTVTDDDGEPTLSIDSPNVAEGDSSTATMTFKVTLSPASGKPVSVTYADAATGTATPATDYAAISSGTLNFVAGDTEKTVAVTVNGDTTDEPNETVILRLSSPSNAALSGGAQTLDGTGTINDDDGTPTVILELDPASIAESGDDNATTVTASLSGASSQAVTLTVAAAAVSPAVAGDFTLSGTTLTIAAGATESTGTVTVTAVDNDVDAANKTVTVSATATGGNGVGNPASATLAITDDDERGIRVAPVALTLAEVDDPLTESIAEHRKTYTVELDSQPTGTVAVSLSSGDTTVATLSDNSLEFTASDWDAQTVTVTAVPDAVDNAGDARAATITHTVSAAGTDYQDETAAPVDLTVTDDDDAPDGITLSVDTNEVAEDAGKTSITVTATVGGGTRYSADTTVTVTVGESTDSAVSGTDYARVSAFDLVITAGEASVSRAFDLTPTDDALDEADETISVTGESGSLTVTGTSITLTDDDVPELGIAAGSAVTEGTAAGFTVNADIAPAADLTVNLDVATTDSFAASGTTGGKTLTFRAGRTSETYTVSTQADTTDEPDGSATVTLKAGTDYSVDSSEGSASVDVNDDDATTVALARSGSGGIAEDGGTVDVTITLGRSLVAGEGVTVPLAVSGATVTTHYTLALKGTGGTGISLVSADPHSAQDPAVEIEGAGARTATLTLTAVANTDNASRTVSIAYGTSARAPSSSGLSGGISTSGSASVPILDDDAMVSVAAASAAEGSAVVFTVTLPENAPSGGVSVGYSTSDGRDDDDDDAHQVATSADYTAAAENATLTITQGRRSGTISIPTTQDTTYEGDHHFTLTLDSTSHFNLSTTADSAIGTITDTADAPSFAFSAASTDADEDDGTLTLTVEKTGTTLVAATVSYATTNGTATGGSDFTAITSTDLSFAAADTSKDITVSLTDDSVDEVAEAFTVGLAAGAHARLGGTNSHTVNIADNDATTVKLTASSTAIDENAGTRTITVELGRALTGDETLDVPLAFSGTATFGTDYTLAAPNSTPTGVSYSNLASTNLAEDPPTIAFSGVSGAAASATVILTAIADTIDEGAVESVTVGLGTLNASSGENLDGGASGSGTATFNITDDDDAPALPADNRVYVSPGGDDSTGVGTESSPWATLTQARDAIAAHLASLGNQGMTGDITVYLRAGTHRLTETFELGAEDSGNNGFKVLYRNYPGEEPIVSGGTVLTGWSESTTTDRNGNTLYETSVAGDQRFRQMYVGGEAGVRAREPNLGKTFKSLATTYARVNNPDRLLRIRVNHNRDGEPGRDEVFTSLVNMNSAEISQVEHWQLTFFNSVMVPIESFSVHSDGVTGLAEVRGEAAQRDAGMLTRNSIGSRKKDMPYYWENALAFIDVAGEWFLDDSTNKVYYKPKASEVSAGTLVPEITAPMVETLLRLEHARNIGFFGIRFQHSNFTSPSSRGYIQRMHSLPFRYEDASKPFPTGVAGANTVRTAHAWSASPGAIEIKYSSNIHFERNAFRHFAANGMVLLEGAKHIGIEGNVFSETVDTHLVLHGGLDPNPPDADHLQGISIANNVMERPGATDKLGMNIYAGYPDRAYIQHNHLLDANGGGINLGWHKWFPGQMPSLRNNSIRYNKMENLLGRINDWSFVHLKSAPNEGVTHTDVWRNWATDIRSTVPPNSIIGWYLDDRTNRAKARENVTTMVRSGGFKNVFLQDPSKGPAENNIVNRNFFEDTKRNWTNPTGAWNGKLLVPYGAEDQPLIDLVKKNAGLEPSFNDLAGLKHNGSLGGSRAPTTAMAGLVSRWLMNRSVEDVLPIGNNLALSGGAGYSEDAMEGAHSLSIGATGHYATATGYKGILGSASRTFAAWVKTTDSDAVVASWGNDVSGGKWVVRTDGTRGTAGALSVDVNGGHVVGSTVVADGGWHHVAVVFEEDGTPDVKDVRMYVDGLLQPLSAEQSATVSTTSGQDLRLGSSSALAPGAEMSGGLIDDVRLYDRALLASEVAHLAVKHVAANWSFENNLVDSSGNGHTLALRNGATYSSGGMVGTASLSLDGTDDYAVATRYKGIIGTAPRTISAWIRTTDTSGTIVSWGNDNALGKRLRLHVHPYSGKGVLRFEAKGSFVQGSTQIADGQWHHVAVVWINDGTPSASDAVLFVDGYPEKVSSNLNSNTLNTASDGVVHVGTSIWSAGAVTHLFAGEIDNLRILNHALTPVEVNGGFWPISLPSLSMSGGSEIVEGGDARFTLHAMPAPTMELEVDVFIADNPETNKFLAKIDRGGRKVTIPANQNSVEFTVPTEDDDAQEADGNVTAAVAGASGYIIGTESRASVSVRDNDAPLPSISISAGEGITEGGDIEFTVAADGMPATDLEVTLNIADDDTSDFLAPGDEGMKTVTIPANKSAVVHTLSTVNDSTLEANGSVSATVIDGDGYSVGAPSSAKVAVADDDTPVRTVSISGGSDILEGGHAEFTVMATPTLGVSLDVSLDIADDSTSDFLAQVDEGAKSVTIPPNQSSTTYTLATVNDGIDEEDGTVSATLTAGAGYILGTPTVAEVAVADNDTAFVIEFADATSIVDEAAGTHNVEVTLSTAPSMAISFGYAVAGSAARGRDYTGLDGTVSVPANAFSVNIPLPIVDDSEVEASETVVLTLMAASGYTLGTLSAHTVTIRDNEPAAFYVSPGGDDVNGSGSKNAPWATLEKAREAVAAYIKGLPGLTKDVIVYLRGGTHRLANTLELGAADSGNSGFKVLYRNYPGEAPIVSGGKLLAGWAATRNGSGIYDVSVAAGDRFRQLYIGNQAGIRAREPDGTYRGTATGHFDSDTSRLNSLLIRRDSDSNSRDDPEFTSLIGMSAAEVSQVEYWQLLNWRFLQLPIASFKNHGSDTSLGVAGIRGDDARKDGKLGATSDCAMNCPYYWENALDFIDTAGEWFLDEAANRVYYRPKSGEVAGNTIKPAVTVPVVETLVRLEGAQNIWFYGIRFQHSNDTGPSSRGYVQAAAGLQFKHEDAGKTVATGVSGKGTVGTAQAWAAGPGAIELKNSSNIHFERNAFRHLAANGVVLEAGAKHVGIEGNVFSETGDTHIVLHGGLNPSAADAERLEGISIANNLMEKPGAGDKLGINLFAGYPERAYIHHNHLLDANGGGINLGWGEWTVGQMPALRNNSVRHNRFEKLLGRVKDWGVVHLKSATDAGVVHTDVSRNWAGSITNLLPDSSIVGWYLNARTNRARVRENVVSGVTSGGFDNVLLQTPAKGVAENNEVAENFHEDTGEKWSFSGGDHSSKVTVAYPASDQPTIDLVTQNAGLEPSFRNLARLKDSGSLGGSGAPTGAMAGMVSRWLMNRSVEDVLPIGNNLALSGGAGYSEDAMEGAHSLSIGATGHYATATGYKGILGSASRTFAAWVKTTDSDAVVASWGNDVSGGKWVVRTDGTRGTAGALSVDVNGGHVVGSTVVADGGWHHVAVVFEEDGTPDVKDVRMYVDGLLQPLSAEQSATVSTTSGQDLRLGSSSALAPGAEMSGGLIDDVRLYDRALLASEVAHLAVKHVAANWSFENNLVDSSGNGRALTLRNGATYSSNGAVGDASLQLDGINDYAVATGYKGVTGTKPRTISAWIRTTQIYGSIVTWGKALSRQRVRFHVHPIKNIESNPGVIRFEVQGSYSEGTTPVNDGQWHHVAVVWVNDGSPSGGDAELFVDGYPETTVNRLRANTLNTVAQSDVHIGTSFWSLSHDKHIFTGEIDNLRIFNEALSPVQINELARR